MKAIAVTDVGKVGFVDVPMPTIREYEALVKITACGLCNGTDMKTIDSTLGNVREQYPCVLGHEAVGVVVEAGPAVRSFTVGDTVTDPVPAIESDVYRPGCAGFCEYGVVQDKAAMEERGLPRAAYRPLTDRAAIVRREMSCEDAVMLVTFKETYSALGNFGLSPGMSVLLFGDGPNGLALAAFAKLLGAGYVAVAGHWDDRLRRLRETAHVDRTVNTHREDLAAVFADRTFDLVVDAVGSTAVIRQGFRLLKRCGKLAVFGVLKNDDEDLSIRAMPNGASLQMLSWPVGASDVHGLVVGLVESGELVPRQFYSHVDSWENIEEAIELVHSREAFKVILRIGDAP